MVSRVTDITLHPFNSIRGCKIQTVTIAVGKYCSVFFILHCFGCTTFCSSHVTGTIVALPLHLARLKFILTNMSLMAACKHQMLYMALGRGKKSSWTSRLVSTHRKHKTSCSLFDASTVEPPLSGLLVTGTSLYRAGKRRERNRNEAFQS